MHHHSDECALCVKMFGIQPEESEMHRLLRSVCHERSEVRREQAKNFASAISAANRTLQHSGITVVYQDS